MLDKQIELEWKYLFDNIGYDGRPVAALIKKASDETILLVFEDHDSHYTKLSIDFSFLTSSYVSYSRESIIVNQQNDLSYLFPYEVLALQLKVGCRIIENNIRNQIDHILKKIL